MPVNVCIREWGERLVIHHNDIRRRAGFEHAERLFEITGTNRRVIPEQHPGCLAPADCRVTGIMPLHGQQNLEAFQHVMGIGIGPQPNQNPLVVKRKHRRTTDGIPHIGFWIVANHGVCFLQDLHFGWRNMDTVSQHGFFSQNAVIQQAVYRAAAIIPQGIIYIVHPLRHMDMETGHAVVCLDHRFKCFIRNRKQGVSAEHRTDHIIVLRLCPAGEVCILLNGLTALFLPIPLGDLITKASAHTKLFTYVPNGEQRTGNFPERSVMVKNSGYTVPDAVKYGCISAGLGAVQCQMPVNIPPLAVQHLIEISWLEAVNRQPPRKAAVNMRMDVNQPWHYYAALCIYKLCIRIRFPQLVKRPYLTDNLPVNRNSPVFQIRAGLASSNKPAVSNQQHIWTLLSIYFLF